MISDVSTRNHGTDEPVAAVADGRPGFWALTGWWLKRSDPFSGPLWPVLKSVGSEQKSCE